MVQTYYESDLGEEKKKVQIRRLLELGQEKINEIRDYSGYRCCINTELNSGNFLMNGAGKDNYLVDWEKPLYGDPVQDLGHFLAPNDNFLENRCDSDRRREWLILQEIYPGGKWQI